MRRRLAFLGVVLFVVGVLVVPAVHKLHLDHRDPCGHSESESHNPQTCAICTVAATAVVVAFVHIAAILTQQPSNIVSLPEILLIDLLIPESHQARAPPGA